MYIVYCFIRLFFYTLTDMGRCEITRGRQALELRSNLSERRSLTDHIETSEHCSASYSARNLQWAVAHGTLLTNTILVYRILQDFSCLKMI